MELTTNIQFADHRLSSWRDVVEATDHLSSVNWVFRGHERAEWSLQASLEREFGARGADVEQKLLWRFVRLAPRLLPGHLVPSDNDAAAWLGLVQHYGGPTRLLDVTRSPYVALFFAFEAVGDADRAVWAVDHIWCMKECARIMAENETKPVNELLGRTLAAQSQLVYSLVHRQAFRDPLFASFTPFAGVFTVAAWKPDQRQAAQQAMFLCAANPAISLIENFAAHRPNASTALCRLVMPAMLRDELLDRLSYMNVSAATLFPDLAGLARSLRTLPVERPAG